MLKIIHSLKNIPFTLFLVLSFQLHAQDIHYSQFGRSPLNINPALTGLFKGDVRFIGNYRSQWNKVPVNYMTFSGGIDQSLFSAAVYLNHDEAGDLNLSNTNINLSGSFTRRLATKHYLTAGIQLGGTQRRFDISKLQVDSQYDGDGFNASLPTGENTLNANVFYADLGGGVNYRFQNMDNRMKLDFGAAIFHANRPDQSFFKNGSQKLEPRWSYYGMTTFGIGKIFDVGLQAIGQFQGPHLEILVGGMGKIHLNQERDKELAVALSLAYRLGDAWVPSLAVDYRMWSVGFSYDINSSPFNIASFRRGGPELSVIYIFSKVRPPKEFEICPLF